MIGWLGRRETDLSISDVLLRGRQITTVLYHTTSPSPARAGWGCREFLNPRCITRSLGTHLVETSVRWSKVSPQSQSSTVETIPAEAVVTASSLVSQSDALDTLTRRSLLSNTVTSHHWGLPVGPLPAGTLHARAHQILDGFALVPLHYRRHTLLVPAVATIPILCQAALQGPQLCHTRITPTTSDRRDRAQRGAQPGAGVQFEGRGQALRCNVSHWSNINVRCV